MPPSLYLVATPIGNLGDITFRAVKVLKEVDLILAEDTRTSGVLLKHYSIGTPVSSFHSFNEHKKVDQLVSDMKAGKHMALISDAGTPSISDPGYLLTRATLDAELEVQAIPGATALIAALIKSGFPSEKFVFEGFLPHKKGRKTRLEKLSEEDRTIVLYESPHRLLKTLEQIKAHMGPMRMVSVSRELTKKFEETINGPVADLCDHFENRKPKGEFVVVISPEGHA